jgi:hypothetical protein
MSHLKETRNDLTRRYRIQITQERADLEALTNILTRIDNDESLEESRRKLLRKLCNEQIDVLLAFQDAQREEFLSDNS